MYVTLYSYALYPELPDDLVVFYFPVSVADLNGFRPELGKRYLREYARCCGALKYPRTAGIGNRAMVRLREKGLLGEVEKKLNALLPSRCSAEVGVVSNCVPWFSDVMELNGKSLCFCGDLRTEQMYLISV